MATGTVPAERGVAIDEHDVVNLVHANFVEANVVDHFSSCGVFTDDDHFGGHHAACGVFLEAHELFHFAGFAMLHFLQDFF